MAKAQVSVEQLMSYASLMAMLIPLTLLFLTLSSINTKELDSNSLDISLNDISNEVELVYGMCGGDVVERTLSLRIPENVVSIDFDDSIIPGELYIVVSLNDGSQILKRLSIPVRAYDNFRFSLPSSKRGNILLHVSCVPSMPGYYDIEVGG